MLLLLLELPPLGRGRVELVRQDGARIVRLYRHQAPGQPVDRAGHLQE